MKALQGSGLLPSNVGGVQETPQQKRRRLLQAAKIQAVDHYWSFAGTTTAETRAAARLRIDREMRNEPLEEWTSQEVNELAEGVRDRIYNSFLREQEKDAQRTREVKERTRRDRSTEERRQQDRSKRKLTFLHEARRRAAALIKTRSLSLFQEIQVMHEILTHLDAVLTGAEPLSEAYGAIDAALQARIAEWDAYDAAKDARQEEEWWEFGTAIVGIIALGFMCVKAPDILNLLLKILWPDPAKNSGSPPTPTPEAPRQPSDAQSPQPPIRRRVRRSPQSVEPRPPTSSNPNRQSSAL